jgi:hypothetical protein
VVTIADISGLASVLTAARKLLHQLQQGKLSSEHQPLVADALDVVADASNRLFKIQTDLIELQQENTDLRKKCADNESWSARRAAYELFQTSAGGLVLRYTGLPEHFACPRCAESAKELHVLQPPPNKYAGSTECRACGAFFEIEIPRPIPPFDPYANLR